MPTSLSGRTNEDETEPESRFPRYNDSRKAERVWLEYLPEIYRYNLFDAAAKFAVRCRTSDTLDMELDMLVTYAKMLHRAHPVIRHIVEDTDAQGYHANARRLLEEC